MNEWASFIPPLAACLAATDGAVLEVGVGHFSTPFLRAYCSAAGRHLVSLESDPQWCKEMSAQWTDYDSELPLYASKFRWDVVLLDHSPGEKRARHGLLFVESAELIVAHDYMSEQKEAWEPLLNDWRYKKLYTAYNPPTIVLSNSMEIPF